jgi:hypothetical protein
VTLSATSENNLGVIRFIANLPLNQFPGGLLPLWTSAFTAHPISAFSVPLRRPVGIISVCPSPGNNRRDGGTGPISALPAAQRAAAGAPCNLEHYSESYFGNALKGSGSTLRVTPRATKTRLFHETSGGVEDDVQGSRRLRLGVSVHQESLAILGNIIREQIC